jgi:hypothetical protein
MMPCSANLYLESKKARGEALEPYSLLVPQTFLGEMVCLYRAARTFFKDNPGS